MSADQRRELQTAILTICDPRGNWKYGWEMICGMAGVNPERHTPPFRTRTEDDLREMGSASSIPPLSRVRPPKDA